MFQVPFPPLTVAAHQVELKSAAPPHLHSHRISRYNFFLPLCTHSLYVPTYANHTVTTGAMVSILFILLTATTVITLTVHLLLFLSRALKQPALEFYARSIASFAALFICATYGTVASACLNVVGYGGLGQWTTARAFKYTMLLFTGVWFEIEDEGDWLNTTRPAVFVGNHQTELDVLFLGHMFPKYCSVTAKKSLKYTPFLGWFSMYTPLYPSVSEQ